MKKQKTLHDYLEQSGILEHGSPEAIRAVKADYWKQFRKEWRKKQRATSKCCTVYFTPIEYKTVAKAFTNRQKLAGFVKQAALNAANNKNSLTKEMVGQIRELLFINYAVIEGLTNDTKILTSLIELERTILNNIK